MADLPEFRVYLSSTIEDIAEERKAAINIVRQYAVVKDSYRASENGVVATCTGDVRNCHLYVGIIGQRYGWIPDMGENDPAAKSITELEYEACNESGHRKINRLIFVRTTNPDKFSDAHSRTKTSERIKRFRARAAKEQQAYEFNSVHEFEKALIGAIIDKRDSFHRERLSKTAMFEIRKAWKGNLRPVCLVRVPGDITSPIILEKLVQARDHLFSVKDITPDDVRYLASLDQAIQTAQLTCICITPAALQRFSLAPQKITDALEMMRLRNRYAVILLIGVNQTDLPAEWKGMSVEQLDVQKFGINPGVEADDLYTKLQSRMSLTTETRLAVPWLVIAPTQDEVNELLDPGGNIFDAFEDEDVREQRRRQLNQLVTAVRTATKGWPDSVYGKSRFDWRCFGEKSQSVVDMLKDVITTINNSPSGSRERQRLQDATLMLRSYDLDEFLTDRFGSRSAIEWIRDRGCVVIVDELALLHPKLRSAADKILASSNVAAVSINPCDPTYLSVSRLLGEASFLRVGTLVSRFKDQYDPQCELALNSEDRVGRWLRHAIPRLVADTDQSVGRPTQAHLAVQYFTESK